MKRVLQEDVMYPYLKPNAAHRLEVARHLARNTGMLEQPLVHLGGYSYCLFPWLGTRSFRTLRKFIARNAAHSRVSGIEFEGCCYISFKMEKGDPASFSEELYEEVCRRGIQCEELVGTNENPVFEKYDDYIPGELLRRAYAADKLRADEAERRIAELYARTHGE
jgi:ATP-dependent Lhr-like helicase